MATYISHRRKIQNFIYQTLLNYFSSVKVYDTFSPNAYKKSQVKLPAVHVLLDKGEIRGIGQALEEEVRLLLLMFTHKNNSVYNDVEDLMVDVIITIENEIGDSFQIDAGEVGNPQKIIAVIQGYEISDVFHDAEWIEKYEYIGVIMRIKTTYINPNRGQAPLDTPPAPPTLP